MKIKEQELEIMKHMAVRAVWGMDIESKMMRGACEMIIAPR